MCLRTQVLNVTCSFYRYGPESASAGLPTAAFHAITVLFQSPIVRAIALEPVHVYATYVAQLVEMRAVTLSSPANDGHFEYAAAGQRFHREQILDTAGLSVHATRDRSRLAQRQCRAHVSRADGRPILDQQPVQLSHHVRAPADGRLAAPVQLLVPVARAPMGRDARLLAGS